MIKPITLGDWSRITQYGLDKGAIFTTDRLMCMINHYAEPSTHNPYGAYVVTFPRPDGLFEHIYIMGQGA